MKSQLLLLGLALFAANSSMAESKQQEITFTANFGSENEDFTRLLYFQEIGSIKSNFKGDALAGKNYQIAVYEFENGIRKSREILFDSSEDEYFKIHGDELSFYTFAQKTSPSEVKIEVQFPGFSKGFRRTVDAQDSEFALKDFTAGREIKDTKIGQEQPVVAYIMPYKKSDGSQAYCEVVQSDVSPYELGLKYNIKRYYLLTIKFN